MPVEKGRDRPENSPDDWSRIETEKEQRAEAARNHDAAHGPSEEFEQAARPLGDDYGRDRPRHRELTPQQRAELEEFTGRPADEVLRRREDDPRAAHNRDENRRIRSPEVRGHAGSGNMQEISPKLLRRIQDDLGAGRLSADEAQMLLEAYGGSSAQLERPSDRDDAGSADSDEEPRTQQDTVASDGFPLTAEQAREAREWLDENHPSPYDYPGQGYKTWRS